MDNPQSPTRVPQEGTAALSPPGEPKSELPPGSHAVEVAARAGFGPLSDEGHRIWHGDARPCVSCGQLVRRDSAECQDCGQDMSGAMIDKMRRHAGPWYVLEHVRPFPGVSLERIIRQVRRGLITETSIVRGPATDHQWRFAVETPGLSRYFGRCWNCYGPLSVSDGDCPACGSCLSFDRPQPSSAGPPVPRTGGSARTAVISPDRAVGGRSHTASAAQPLSEPQSEAAPAPAPELQQLSAAVHQAELPAPDAVWDEPPRIAGVRATWIAAVALVVVIIALMILTRSETDRRRPIPSVTPGMVQPAP